MNDCLEIVYQTGFFYKHQEVYGKEELEVVEKINDLKQINYSLFESCEIDKSQYYAKLNDILKCYQEIKENKQVEDLLALGWLNTILNREEKGIQKELDVDYWDDRYLSYEYTFISVIEVYSRTHTLEQVYTFLKEVSIEMFYQIKGIETFIQEYQSHCKKSQYENLKSILIDLFSEGIHKVEIEHQEEVYEIIRNCLELKSFIIPFYLLCYCYKKDFDDEYQKIKGFIDCHKLKEKITLIPHLSTQEYFRLEYGKDLYFYKKTLHELPLGFQSYFNNLQEEYQRIILSSSLFNKQEMISILKKMEEWYQLYPMKEFVDDFYNDLNKEKYALIKLLEQVLDDCLKQEYGKATVEITLSLIMNQKLRLAVFGF
ncbi:MAG: hypothetical protein Q4Q31_08200 [Bacillota bacterium]|nr:hypothetical protein [Bacillota bacterium]